MSSHFASTFDAVMRRIRHVSNVQTAASIAGRELGIVVMVRDVTQWRERNAPKRHQRMLEVTAADGGDAQRSFERMMRQGSRDLLYRLAKYHIKARSPNGMAWKRIVDARERTGR